MSSTSGKCVVCGKECITRCGPCASHNVPWMFFCSVSHQKLMWVTHKRVCGKDRWEWPVPTKQEAKWISESVATQGGEEEEKFRDNMIKMGGPLGNFMLNFSSVLTNERPFVSEALGYNSPEDNLQAARRVTYIVRCAAGDPGPLEVADSRVFKVVAEDPFCALAYLENKYWKNLHRGAINRYFSDVHHRLLIHFTLLGMSHRDELKADELKLYFQHSFDEIEALVQQADFFDTLRGNILLTGLVRFSMKLMSSKTKIFELI